MFPPKALLPILILLLAASRLMAQVHEEAPVDLAKGLIVEQAAADKGAVIGSAEKTRVAQSSFAAAALVDIPAPASEIMLLGQGDAKEGWRLFVTADGALRFEGRVKDKPAPITVATPAGVVAPGSMHHVAVNILRDPTKPNAGIWLDGVELTSGVVPPVNLSAPSPLTVGVAAKHVRLYHRDLTRAEVLALQLDALTDGKPKPRHPERDGPRFIPQPNETVALIGGTEAVAVAESGELEARLLLNFPLSRFHVRSLAWEGDTVFRQDRPLNFGDLRQQLRRVNAGAVIMVFGRQESLDLRSDQLGEFEAAFDRLLEKVKAHTPNIIIAAPPAIQPIVAHSAAFDSLNEARRRLLDCCLIMERLAAKHRVVYAKSYLPMILDGPPRTRDGVTLTDFGVHEFTLSILSGLGIRSSGATDESMMRSLLDEVRSKNRLWHHYWRPTNWAFLHGDRTQQPSSRDHLNPQLRFFPAEQEKYLPLIKEAEQKIYKLVEETTKKLP
jgi:hypothetical protein